MVIKVVLKMEKKVQIVEEISEVEFEKLKTEGSEKSTLDCKEVREKLMGRVLSRRGVERVIREMLGKPKSWQLWWSVWKRLHDKWTEEGLIIDEGYVEVSGRKVKFYKFAGKKQAKQVKASK